MTFKASGNLAVSWGAMLLTSSLTLTLWRDFAGGEPYWWPWLVALGLIALLVLALTYTPLRPSRVFISILVLLFVLGFGGGWPWGLIPWVRSSQTWIGWANEVGWAEANIALHVLRLTPALAVVALLVILGRRRHHFFLTLGDARAPAEPSRLIGMKKPEPWTRIGSIFAAVFSAGTFLYLEGTSGATWTTFFQAMYLVPIAFFIAAINAFNEEFTLRAAPLSELSSSVGRQQSLLISTTYFGLGHYYGIPSGLLGVLLSGFLGWFLGKSLLETRGFFWAWTIHFLQDSLIFTFVVMGVA